MIKTYATSSMVSVLLKEQGHSVVWLLNITGRIYRDVIGIS